jgi:hypothetical protein
MALSEYLYPTTSWFVQAVVAAVATVVTLPYGVLVGVVLYLDLRPVRSS